MPKDQAARTAALDRLKVFVGEWRLALGHPSAPPTDGGIRSVFEWVLDGQFLVQRSETPAPGFPSGIAIVAYDPTRGAYTQHYFDSRGVVRLYAMTFRDGTWTLLRNSPDFTPLDFSQRFIGRFSPDGNVITGTWEKASDGKVWTRDFDLSYWRVEPPQPFGDSSAPR